MTTRILDLFCCQGAALGYQRAGFDVVGVDIEPQPRYPFPLIEGDALLVLEDLMGGWTVKDTQGKDWRLDDFDAIHASPPCQKFSEMQKMHKNQDEHPDLIAPVREFLMWIDKPWVIENVEGAPLETYFMLCGTMFGLPIIKHRLFETSWPMPVLMPACRHVDVYDRYHGGEQAQDEKTKHAEAQGIPVGMMDRYGARQAIPPAYTEYIGRHLIAALEGVTP